MKTTITITKDDSQKNLASQGRNGDNQLAHVNGWEAQLLKMLGGSGTTNPNTGLKEYYTDYTGGSYDKNVDWFGGPQQYADAITGKIKSGGWTSLQDPTGAAAFYNSNPQYFNTGTAPKTGNQIDFPTNLMPTTNSNSYSGLPSSYQNQLLSALIPQLNSSISNFNTNVDDYTKQALGSYQQSMEAALRENIPKAIAALANRGILSSTAGNEILADVNSAAATDAANKGYQTAMQAAMFKANWPSVLAQIADLGKTSSSTSTSQDPTEMYKIMASLLAAQM